MPVTEDEEVALTHRDFEERRRAAYARAAGWLEVRLTQEGIRVEGQLVGL